MQDLTLVGLTEDKTKLVLVSDSGEEYSLPADARLRAALRGDHARLGQLEIEMESSLRPRDIQARIRAGESAEAVAQAAQTSVDRIMGYATPVLAERAHIADRAQRASVRRKAGEGPARVLGEAVAERLRTKNVDPASVEWDAWRREDGRWTLVADYRSGERTRHAEFVFDAPGRYVVAEDDEARWLVGEQSARKAPSPKGATAGGRRLSPVTSEEEELPLGTDAIELVTGSAPQPEQPDLPDLGPERHTLASVDDLSPHERTVDLSQTARELRERPDAGAETGDADWIATQASERPATKERPADDEVESGDTEAGAASAEEPEAEPEPETPKKTTRKGRRASVPSWDEIMFGGGRSE